MHPAIIAASGNRRRNQAQSVAFEVSSATNLTILVRVRSSGTSYGYKVVWGDGTTSIVLAGSGVSKTYSSAYSGFVTIYTDTGYIRNIVEIQFVAGNWIPSTDSFTNLTFLETIGGDNGGLRGDIALLPKSLLLLRVNTTNQLSGNVIDLPPNLTSAIVATGNSLTGDLNNAPKSLLTFSISTNNRISGLIQNAPPNITSLNITGNINTLSGNVGLIPSTITTLRTQGNMSAVSDYTAGHIWASVLNDIRILPKSGSGLSSTEVDNILIDMAATVTGATGTKTIFLNGNNAPRTAASNAAYNYLTGLTFSVQTN